MNKKYILFASLLIALIIAFFTWDSVNVIDVNAETLSQEYADDAASANNKYLNKNLRVEGNVKAYYKIMGARPVLELETAEGGIPIFFFFLSQENESYAGQLQSGQHVIIRGKCVGEDEYSFVSGVKIEVDKFIEK